MYIKICGITCLDQAQAIAAIGIDALGFICVPQSRRYIPPERLQLITNQLPDSVERIGVFVNADYKTILSITADCQLSGIQLHGQESISYCVELKQSLSAIKIIKAVSVRHSSDLAAALSYTPIVDILLLDAYDPNLLGGTGKQIEWSMLKNFTAPIPWWLAGGLNPENVLTALSLTNPDGIDLSSGVEISAGNKDITKVQRLYNLLKRA
ncbi:MAG: phosphoribosylanthranilate isomerase [Pseudanabaenaceae cyanobacterium]